MRSPTWRVRTGRLPKASRYQMLAHAPVLELRDTWLIYLCGDVIPTTHESRRRSG